MRYRIATFLTAVVLVSIMGGFPLSPVASLVGIKPASVAAQYSDLVESWRPTVQAACGVGTWCETRIMQLISCESGGDQWAVSERINPETGDHDYGLLQLSTYWVPYTYADGATQITWAAPRLGSVWWAC